MSQCSLLLIFDVRKLENFNFLFNTLVALLSKKNVFNPSDSGNFFCILL